MWISESLNLSPAYIQSEFSGKLGLHREILVSKKQNKNKTSHTDFEMCVTSCDTYLSYANSLSVYLMHIHPYPHSHNYSKASG